ncbi:MAG TPA: DNA mismatch repair protein MutS [Thermoplasmata archaeon]|nr:DNA mismatch repair protein MutS [Thermoplasmata archaeon]
MAPASVSTPLLDQYEGVKAQYPGHLVLFRVGDFYETFGDDAKLLSREVDVVLTARSADARGARTPMAGVPYHAVETYLGRLVRKGYKVAICDQVEDARYAKGLVRREVTRVVTPGTVVEERILGGPDHSFLASAVVRPHGVGAYAAVDITTGEWFQGEADGPDLEGVVSALAPFQPREIVVVGGSDRGPVPELMHREFPVARIEPAPSPLSKDELPPGLRGEASGAPTIGEAGLRLAAYLRATQPRLLPHLAIVDRGTSGRRLVLDAKTLRHLEIARPMNPDDPAGATLLGAFDETRTAAGRRTLSFWLTNPLCDVAAIEARQASVAALIERGAGLEAVRSRLRSFGDLDRIASRAAGRRTHPPELGVLRTGLTTARLLREELAQGSVEGALARIVPELAAPAELETLLATALPDEPPATDDSGGLFRTGFAPEVDRWREDERAALDALSALEHREQAAAGGKGIKVGYNQVFGYYFEVTRPNLGRVPPHFRRRQTVSQAERFTSDELDEIERRIRTAREAARAAEIDAWEEFLGRLDRHVGAIHRVARGVGEVDALATFAHLARSRGYVRPTVDDGPGLVVRDGRHPVLERQLGERFVPNDIELDASACRLLVLTGPNMSGKSTYMRAVGLLVVLAQAGSYVPARFARVGLVTQLFTRMGFTDEIGRGKSSFMVEMTEVAEILRSADARSLVLLDEVGRGTSTFDGLAIAWATLRHLHDTTKARSVLATHYHQLTELVGGLRGARNAHFAVQETPDGIVFLHRLVPGATDRSYGVHVARLAGLPESLLGEADRLLRRLEAEGVALPPGGRTERPRSTKYTQAVLWDAGGASNDPIRERLRTLEPDRLTEPEARKLLEELRRIAADPREGAE